MPITLGELACPAAAGRCGRANGRGWINSTDADDGGSTPTVRLSAAPNPVTEGSSVTVTATLSEALASSVTIPVAVERGTSESGDHGSLSGILDRFGRHERDRHGHDARGRRHGRRDVHGEAARQPALGGRGGRRQAGPDVVGAVVGRRGGDLRSVVQEAQRFGVDGPARDQQRGHEGHHRGP